LSDVITKEFRGRGILKDNVYGDLSDAAATYLPPLSDAHRVSILLAKLLTGNLENARWIYQTSLEANDSEDLLQKIFKVFPEAEKHLKTSREVLNQPKN